MAGRKSGFSKIGQKASGARRLMAQRSLEINPKLKEQMSVDDAMDIVTGRGDAKKGSSRSGPRPAAHTPPAGAQPAQALEVVVQSLNHFVSGTCAQLTEQLARIQKARSQLDSDEAQLRQRCGDELKQYLVFLMRGNQGMDLDDIVRACTPLLEIAGTTPSAFRKVLAQALAAESSSTQR